MRLYLSSYQLGSNPQALGDLLGDARRAVIIANALDPWPDEGRGPRVTRQADALATLGCTSEELDLRDFFGREQALAERLAAVDLLWVHGGNSFVLKRAFEQSGLDNILPRRLGEDTLVYGGFSAALMMVMPTLRGIELCDDPVIAPEGYAPQFDWTSLGLVPQSLIPHYRSNHPEAEMMEDVVAYMEAHGLPYLCLRDGEALVVKGSATYVAGEPADLAQDLRR